MTDHDSAADTETPGRLSYSTMAIASFALGVISLFLFAVPMLAWPLSVLAVVLGHTGSREIKQGAKQGWGYDIGGLILGYLVLVTLAVGAFTRG